jgi:hypothetical protein
MSEQAAETPDPNYILSQEEFHASQADQARMHGETQGAIARQFKELRRSAGYTMIVLALWLGYCGWLLTKERS